MSNHISQEIAARIVAALRKYGPESEGWSYLIFGRNDPQVTDPSVYHSVDGDIAFWLPENQPVTMIPTLPDSTPLIVEPIGVLAQDINGGYCATFVFDYSGRTVCLSEIYPTQPVAELFMGSGPIDRASPEALVSVVCTGEELPA